jgi:uncharacterized delta-60 repeat protein
MQEQEMVFKRKGIAMNSFTSRFFIRLCARFKRARAATMTFLALLIATPAAMPGYAQSVNDGFSPSLGSAYNVSAVLVQPDGKILVGGNEFSVASSSTGIVRLRADGSVDAGFTVSINVGGTVTALAAQADGKIVIGGNFTTVNGVGKTNIARLNADGSLDIAFTTSVNDEVSAIAVQADGKIVVVGRFNAVNGVSRAHIVRLNLDDGSTDFGFTASADGHVHALAVQADGKIVIGGFFGSVNGASRSFIARLHAGGSLDIEFNASADQGVRSIAVQADGKIAVGGSFDTVNGFNRKSLARLNADGSLDPLFLAEMNSAAAVIVVALAIQADGKIVMGGDFSVVNGDARANVARLNPNGSVDTNFVVSPNSYLTALATQSDGSIVMGGNFLSVNGIDRRRLARLDSSGNLDDNFAASAIPPVGVSGTVFAMATQPNGKVVIGGAYTQIEGTFVAYVHRFNANGHPGGVENRFPPLNNAVRAIAIQADGKTLLGGEFTQIGNAPAGRIGRFLQENNAVDTGFNTGTGANNSIHAIVVQPDKKILVGGAFTQFNGTAHNGIVRLKEDGTIDSAFVSPPFGSVSAIALQSDGKILIAGGSNIIRLDSDGGVDASFTSGFSNGLITAIAVQLDGKILVGGLFSTYNGLPTINLGRLNYDGTRDTTFNVGTTGPNATVLSIVIQARGNNIDGSIIIGGQFTLVAGVPRNRLARLNNSGALDTSFNASPTGGPNGSVFSLALQPDGKLLIGGDFSTYNGASRGRIARIATGESATYRWSLLPTGGTDPNRYLAAWAPGNAAPVFSAVEFDYSTDGVNWSPLGSAFRGLAQWTAEVVAPLEQIFYLRARAAIAGGSAGRFEQVKQFYLLPPLQLVRVVSRRTHGAGVDHDLPVEHTQPINGPITVEPRAIGTSHRLVYQFNIAPGDPGTASMVDASGQIVGDAQAEASGMEVIVTMTGIADRQRVKVTLSGVGGLLQVPATIGFLLGDVGSTRAVTASDISAVKAHAGQPVNGNNFRFDLNASGTVDQADIAVVKNRAGQTLP